MLFSAMIVAPGFSCRQINTIVPVFTYISAIIAIKFNRLCVGSHKRMAVFAGFGAFDLPIRATLFLRQGFSFPGPARLISVAEGTHVLNIDRFL